MYGKGEEGESWRKKETDGRNERTEPKVKGTWRRERERNREREREREGEEYGLCRENYRIDIKLR